MIWSHSIPFMCRHCFILWNGHCQYVYQNKSVVSTADKNKWQNKQLYCYTFNHMQYSNSTDRYIINFIASVLYKFSMQKFLEISKVVTIFYEIVKRLWHSIQGFYNLMGLWQPWVVAVKSVTIVEFYFTSKCISYL